MAVFIIFIIMFAMAVFMLAFIFVFMLVLVGLPVRLTLYSFLIVYVEKLAFRLTVGLAFQDFVSVTVFTTTTGGLVST
ncbi:hypothetical protein BD408DRAFT_414443 [Parasitella parasitica]|nr:hypothetical protein BD408DRAFT_414443 [Parasitella parasitica]